MRPVGYKGFVIHPRKKAGFPFYYALIYSSTGDRSCYTVEREDECPPTPEAIVEIAKWEIDQGHIGDFPGVGGVVP